MSLPGRFLTIGGQRIFYHRAGRGRPLLLVHGYLLSHWSLRHIIPALAAEHDVIAIDLPGHGESDRPAPERYRYDDTGFVETVIGVLDELGLERASIFGHSMGGGIALATAARHPDRVDRLVVADACVYPFAVPPEGRAALLPYVGLPIFRTLYTRGMLKAYLKKGIYHDPSFATDELVDYLWERLKRPGGMEAAHASMRYTTEPAPIERALRAVRAPSLVIWGEEDGLFPSTNARRLGADLPGAQVVVIPGCGHCPAEEAPQAVLDAMRPFLAATVDGRSRQTLAAVPA